MAIGVGTFLAASAISSIAGSVIQGYFANKEGRKSRRHEKKLQAGQLKLGREQLEETERKNANDFLINSGQLALAEKKFDAQIEQFAAQYGLDAAKFKQEAKEYWTTLTYNMKMDAIKNKQTQVGLGQGRKALQIKEKESKVTQSLARKEIGMKQRGTGRRPPAGTVAMKPGTGAAKLGAPAPAPTAAGGTV